MDTFNGRPVDSQRLSHRTGFSRVGVLLALTIACLLVFAVAEFRLMLLMHLLCAIPIVLVTAMVYGASHVRTFAIGAMVVWTLDITSGYFGRLPNPLAHEHYLPSLEFVSLFAIQVWLLVFGGLAALLVRWCIEPVPSMDDVESGQQITARRRAGYPRWLVGGRSKEEEDTDT